MARKRLYRVKEVAQLSRVSVRTLHHYDTLGLLRPSARTDAGYRLYDENDLLRLQQILLGRELGLSLEAIRRSLDDPRFDRREALLLQRAELEARLEQTGAMLQAVDAALALLEAETPAVQKKEMDMKQLFDGFEPQSHEAEAEQRWGPSPAFEESRRRTRSYGKAEWQRLAVEQAEVYAAVFSVLQAGKAPSDPAALEAVENHRRCIERWFYPCNYEHHRRLADLYEQDTRFSANIDKYGSGLTPYLVAAIRENCRRYGA